jgi:hypothetical protein
MSDFFMVLFNQKSCIAESLNVDCLRQARWRFGTSYAPFTERRCKMKMYQHTGIDGARKELAAEWVDTMNLIALYGLILGDQNILGTGINRVAGLSYVTQRKGRSVARI